MLRCRVVDARVFYAQMFSLKGASLSGQNAAPYSQEFARHFIALIVREKDAISSRLVRIAPGHNVDENPAL